MGDFRKALFCYKRSFTIGLLLVNARVGAPIGSISKV